MLSFLNFDDLILKSDEFSRFLIKSNNFQCFQIYVRSTDLNRTLLSAVSNFIGFYYDRVGKEEAGVDYPNITDWPRGYVPVPVHTVENKYDYVSLIFLV